MKLRVSTQNKIFIYNLYKKLPTRIKAVEYLILDFFKNPGNFMIYSASDIVEYVQLPLHPVIEKLCKEYYEENNFYSDIGDIIGAIINQRFINYKQRLPASKSSINLFYDKRYTETIEKYGLSRLARWANGINTVSKRMIKEPQLTNLTIKENWNFSGIAIEDSKKLNWVISKLALAEEEKISLKYLYGSVSNTRYRSFFGYK